VRKIARTLTFRVRTARRDVRTRSGDHRAFAHPTASA